MTVIVTNKTFSGKTVVITFQNNTASGQLLDSLAITWPQATNGNLNSIKMGGTVIYNTPTGGGSLSTSSLLGSTAQRTIAAGASQTLTFTFKNNVNTTASNYTGSVHFSPFGTVTWLP
jgi:xanthine dehydrogenase iron-sulfur cluster and FAD-binding subunit A